MAQRTIITENNIHNWVGEAQYNRGLRYVQEGLVLPHYQSGRMIKGWCYPREGQPGIYTVWARTMGIRICDAHCSCSLGKYGICPHVAAVLVHYIREPLGFQRSFWQRLFGLRPQINRTEPVMTTQQAA
jgi:uncharacterized Zn finger protein